MSVFAAQDRALSLSSVSALSQSSFTLSLKFFNGQTEPKFVLFICSIQIPLPSWNAAAVELFIALTAGMVMGSLN